MLSQPCFSQVMSNQNIVIRWNKAVEKYHQHSSAKTISDFSNGI